MASLALVTGAHGFIGRHVCRALVAQGVTVRALGHGTWSSDQAAGWGISAWHEGDITFESLARATKGEALDTLIHCAGSGAVSTAYSAPFEDYQRSVSTVATLLEFVRRLGSRRPRVVLTSSAAVYGDQGDVDLGESSACSPISPYGFNKRAAEELCRSYSIFFGLEISIVRLFSVYGEGLRKQLLWDAANKLHNGHAEFFGTGHELRDWLHVSDAARLLCAAAVLEGQAGFELLNGGGTHATTGQVVTELGRFLGQASPPVFTGETHIGNPRRLTSDSRHSRSQLGWAPIVSLAEGLRRYATWFKTTRENMV